LHPIFSFWLRLLYFSPSSFLAGEFRLSLKSVSNPRSKTQTTPKVNVERKEGKERDSQELCERREVIEKLNHVHWLTNKKKKWIDKKRDKDTETETSFRQVEKEKFKCWTFFAITFLARQPAPYLIFFVLPLKS